MRLRLRKHSPEASGSVSEISRIPLDHFHYEALPTPQNGEHSFRLLQLLPGSQADPVSCEIKTYSINKAPPYEALSYCWGPSIQKTLVLVGKSVLGVTSNVFEALTHLRQPDTPRLLWIDQMCINQQDLPERSYQVSIMRLIYSKAGHTIVWLGPGDEKTEMAVEAVTRLAKIDVELKAAGIPYERLPDLSKILEKYELPPRVGRDSKLYAMSGMLNQPWFRRVWIIQEVAYSQSISVVQGAYQVPWQEFAAAVVLVHDLRMTTFESEQIGKNRKNVLYIEGMRKQIQKAQAAPLRYALNLFRESNATDPRDKVYALVGCSLARREGNPAMLSYERSVDDAYRVWTVYSLRLESALDILSAVNRYETCKNPLTYSWVPDWNAADEEMVSHANMWPPGFLAATRASEIEIRFRDQEKVLGLSGHLLDRIELVGDVYSIRTGATIFGIKFLARLYLLGQVSRSWEAVAQLQKRTTYLPTGEDMWDAYWQTLLFGDSGRDEEEREEPRRDFDEYYDTFRKPYVFIERCKLHWSKHLWAIYCVVALVLIRLGIRGKYKNGSGLAFTRRVRHMGGRRLVRTQTGYIGLAGPQTKAGDDLALFKGGRMPLVIRSVADHWQLVGDSYVHGVMNGEAWQPDRSEQFWIH